MSDVNYFVMDEHTLGYVDNRQPNSFCVMAGKPQLGGYDCKNGPIPISLGEKLRPASLEDFNYFRVCSKYHIT